VKKIFNAVKHTIKMLGLKRLTESGEIFLLHPRTNGRTVVSQLKSIESFTTTDSIIFHIEQFPTALLMRHSSKE